MEKKENQEACKCDKKVNPHLLNADFGYTVASLYAVSIYAYALIIG